MQYSFHHKAGSIQDVEGDIDVLLEQKAQGLSRDVEVTLQDGSKKVVRLLDLEVLYKKNEVSVEHNGKRVSAFPERGGHILSLKIDGTEILYQDMYEETLCDPSKNVKGGIPIMFPMAGPLSDHEKTKSGLNMPQHGIARISEWQQEPAGEGILSQSFVFEKTEEYPFKGELRNHVYLGDDAVEFKQVILNRSDRNMPVSSGLHPYFRIPDGVSKSEIEWRFPQGDYIAEQINVWAEDDTISIPNLGKPFQVFIPGIGELTLEFSEGYKWVWIWSLPGRNFVCIEPVMGNEGNIVKSPTLIEPGQVDINHMKISLKK